MARTRQEVRDFLDSLIGLMVNEKCGVYNGQCVSLIKALLEFLGAPNPYAGRGNARDVGDTLIRQGIAANASGWLNVCVNRDMGRIFENGVWNNYGHIWLDLSGESNYEQNGNRALHTTKNTRPISQAQQIVNLDQYIIADGGNNQMIIQDAPNWQGRCNKTMIQIRGREMSREEFVKYAVGTEFLHWVEAVSDNPEADTATGWQTVGENAVRDRWDLQIYSLQDQLKAMGSRPSAADLQAAKDQAADLAAKLSSAEDARVAAEKKVSELETEKITAVNTGNAFTRWLGEQLNNILGKG